MRGATLTGPTLLANLASRIAGLFARLGSRGELRSASGPTKIRALTREGRWGGASLPEGGVSDHGGPVRGAGDPSEGLASPLVLKSDERD